MCGNEYSEMRVYDGESELICELGFSLVCDVIR